MEFHVVQGKYRLMYKDIPLLIFISGFWCRLDIRNYISDHMLIALIFVVFEDFLISFSSNTVKLDRAWRLGAYPLRSPLLLEGMRAELTIVNRSSPVLELLVLLIPKDNPIILLFGPIEVIRIGVWVCSWPSNYIHMIFLIHHIADHIL